MAAVRPRDLRSIPLFRTLDEPALGGLAERFQTVRFEPGDAVLTQGQPGAEMYIICEGKIEVYREGRGGRRAVLVVRQEGDFIGELALLTREPRSASARALTPVVALRLQRDDFEMLMASNPEMRASIEAAVAERRDRREVPVELTMSKGQEQNVSNTFVDYEEHPQEITLSSIITTLRVHTRVMDLYKQPYDQLREQARLVVEAMKERQEWELVNNAEFGLARQALLRVATRRGPPTPDDLDELLSRVWKEPSFFLAHPSAIAAFGRECTRRGVPPQTVQLFGAPFLTWRGVPLVPSDKVPVEQGSGVPVTRIYLVRTGESRRGVVGLHQPNIGDERLPSFAIRFNGVDQMGVGNYLVSLYFSLAVLADDALATLDGVEVGHYHEYRDAR